ncbi:MAG: CBS domain-containing protein [Candidatus Heimdallarchaeota archaeon]
MSLTMKSIVEIAMLPPALVDENDDISIVAKVLLQANKGCVFVTSQANKGCVFVTSVGEVVGIITERDVLRKLIKDSGVCSPEILAKEFMTKPVLSIAKTATLAEADDVMAQTSVSRLAVVEKEGSLIVVGFIDEELIRASIKIDLLKTIKKRQKYVQK